MNEFYELLENVEVILDFFTVLKEFYLLFAVVLMMLTYFVSGYVIMCTGHKARIQSDWMPFVPVARQLYQMQIASCPWWYIFFFGFSTVTYASVLLVEWLIYTLTKKMAIVIILLLIYMVVNLAFSFLYYRKYFYYFGFNPNTAWIQIIPSFGMVSLTFAVLIAFSDAIHFRGTGGGNDNDVEADSRTIAPKPSQRKAVIIGRSGKYADAHFDVTDGKEVIFGRAAAECNIIFDQYATDISRKHCSIRFDTLSGQYVIVDYSSNGTFLEDGTRLEKNKENVYPKGTVIFLGNRKNTFELS